MAHYFFPKDLADSEKAVNAVLDHLIDNGQVAYHLEGKEEQKRGDIHDETANVDIEVKYDIKSSETGNLCFEIDNGNKLTGICATTAHHIYYVLPHNGKFRLLRFLTDELKGYVLDPANKNVRFVKGGDRRKFNLALVSIDNIIADDVPFGIEIIDAKLSL